ncbi:MAG: biotin/lipoate A/B protein ligase family protein [bacterium]
MQNSWRLLLLSENNPYLNMAVDEAVLLAHSQKKTQPTLRFYTWDPPCISLGYFQKAAEEDRKKWQGLNVPFVRRLSGGRAVFHNHDLTYSFTIHEDYNLLPKNIIQSCQIIGQCLYKGLNFFGISGKLLEINNLRQRAEKKGRETKDCFNVFSSGEILYARRKLIGSAQVRKKGVILQHGSILMNYPPVLGNTESLRTITLKEILGHEVKPEEIIPCIIKGFENIFNVKFENVCLTDEEKKTAKKLELEYRQRGIT